MVVDGVDLRARLPHLRNGFRGGHRLLPSHRFRADRPRRRDADRALARRGAHLSGPVHRRISRTASSKASPRPGLTVNFPYLLDVQATHAAWIIAWALEHGVTEVEAARRPPRPPGSTRLSPGRPPTAERAKTCTPGYYNREGKADAKTRQGSFFFGGPTEYADILRGVAGQRRPGRATRFAAARSGRDRRQPDGATASAGCGRRPGAGAHRRVAIIGAGFGGLGAAVALRRAGIDDSGDHRGRRRRRGHLAAQHLSRRRLRHPEPPLLVLVRAQQILEPHLRSAARDPGLPRVGGRRLRSRAGT